MRSALRAAWHNVPRATLLGAALAVVLLAPALHTGFTDDDDLNSLGNGVLRYHDTTLARLVWQDAANWLQAGRFFPLMFVLLRVTFRLLPGVLAYKAYLVGHVVVNLLLLARLVRRLSGSATLAGLSLPVTAALFQFRLFFDPILSFHGLMPFVVTATLLSLLGLQRFLDGGGRRWLALSAAAYLAALLTYEVVLPFALLHLVLLAAARRGWRATVRLALPFLLAPALCAGVAVFLRAALHVTPPEAYRPTFEPGVYLPALGKQLLAALPLSYYLADPSGLFAPERELPAPRTAALVFAATFTLALFLLLRLRRERTAGAASVGRLAVLGLLLAVLPAVLMASSPHYQALLRVGLGYLPVYAEYFGVGLLLLACALAALPALARRPALGAVVAVAASALVAGAAARTYQANIVVADHLRLAAAARTNLAAALDAGLLDPVAEGEALLLQQEYPMWNSAWSWYCQCDWSRSCSEYFFCLHSGKRLTTVFEPLRASSLPPGPRLVHHLADGWEGPDEGHVFLTTLRDPPCDTGGRPAKRRAREGRLFVRGHDFNGVRDAAGLMVVGVFADPATPGGGRADFALDGRDLRLLRAGRDWALYSFAAPADLLADSLRLLRLGRAPLRTYWAGGFCSEETDGDQTWRWCDGRGVLYLANSTGRAKTVRVEGRVVASRFGTCRLGEDGADEGVTFRGDGLPFSCRLRVEPGFRRLELSSDAPPFDVPGDPRRLVLQVKSWGVAEEP
jgi:hypothetical protein